MIMPIWSSGRIAITNSRAASCARSALRVMLPLGVERQHDRHRQRHLVEGVHLLGHAVLEHDQIVRRRCGRLLSPVPTAVNSNDARTGGAIGAV